MLLSSRELARSLSEVQLASSYWLYAQIASNPVVPSQQGAGEVFSVYIRVSDFGGCRVQGYGFRVSSIHGPHGAWEMLCWLLLDHQTAVRSVS